MAWSRPRQATSAGDILAARRAYQPSRESRSLSYSLRTAARQALAPPRSSPWWWRPATPGRWASARRVRTAVDEVRELSSLALVLAAARSRGLAAPAGPDGCLLEVVEPCTPAARRDVERLLRITAVAGGEVGDGAARPVLEPHGGLQVVLLGTGRRVDLLGKAACPPAERVDEVAAFPGEPRSFQLLVAVPAVGLQLSRR